MSYEAVIFDLDGTLINTIEDLANSMNYVLISRGFPAHDLTAYKYFVGAGMQKLVRQALPPTERDDSTVEECLKAMTAEYSKHLMEKTAPYPGIPELLDALTARKTKMAILSNKPDQFTKTIVEKLLIPWHFELVAGSKENVPKKPDPTAALEIAELIGIPPAKFLYLGDTGIDMQTALGAGMFPVGVLWGFRNREELLANGAKMLILNPLDLLKNL